METDGRHLLEVHLLDWSGDAYGKLARVEFLHKLRDEQHFDSLEALSLAIAADSDQARAYFERCNAAGAPAGSPTRVS